MYLLEYPEFAQSFSYDCGASALQSVLVYYGKDVREMDLVKKLKASKASGVKMSSIVRVAEKYNIPAVIDDNGNTTLLRSLITDGNPVIVLLQAYGKGSYVKDFKDGHYVVAIGYTEDAIIFEDPSAYTRTFLTDEELLLRWHALDDNNEESDNHYLIAFSGHKKYDPTNIKKMP